MALSYGWLSSNKQHLALHIPQAQTCVANAWFSGLLANVSAMKGRT